MNAKKEVKPKKTDGVGTPDVPELKDETKETDGVGTPDVPELEDETKETDDVETLVVATKSYKAKRPLLHSGKTYSVEDVVTGLFEDEELERLLKIGAIVEA